jgi:hypothetical protein
MSINFNEENFIPKLKLFQTTFCRFDLRMSNLEQNSQKIPEEILKKHNKRLTGERFSFCK